MTVFKKDKLQIIGFQSYGTPSKLYVRGRALEDEEIDLQQKGIFNLLLNTWKRFETDEIKHTPINIHLSNKKTFRAETDKDGYFTVDEPQENLEELINSEGWLTFEISYADTHLKREIIHQNKFPGEMLIPSKTSEYGVISDIDDTILHTGVVSSLKWKVLLNTAFKRATKRNALEGTADFYHQLHRGKTGAAVNPIFYVSHSPWNLYRYLELFLKTNNFPKGPILLRSMASFRSRNRIGPAPQKQHEIINILKTYPALPFILIGDSGEKDGDIYITIAKKFPGQIKAIYLRSVSDLKRVQRIEDLFQEYTQIPFLLVKKTADAIAHAKQHGFI
ncbi:App1 family protein [Maribacter sp. 2210JD10-5]|uniref:App1 family protein n=1 Tax=Maribacter sp. 2210JD10-5 TaxID=3386272 RepID=UPI0039BC432E